MIKKIIFYFILIGVCVCILEVFLCIAGNLYLNNLYVHTRPQFKSSEEKTVVLCLGESSTAGLYVKRKDSYPAQLKVMLKRQYPSRDIEVIVPPHVGQNTSQVANRIQHYINVYRPDLIVVMAGYNNEWSLAESHIGKFLNLNSAQIWKVKLLIKLNELRLFKLSRFIYLKYIKKEKSAHVNGLEATEYMWGGPELVRWPPLKWVYPFARKHREAFIKLWRYDIKKIIFAAKEKKVSVILMTYHINPTYLFRDEFFKMANQEKVPLAVNDIIFATLRKKRILRHFLTEDNWHPNSKGYRLIAENVFETIKRENLLEE